MQQTKKMKQLPADMRPYEKCEKFGADALSDTELLAVLLRTGAAGKNALELAQEILCLYQEGNEENGLLNLLYLETASFRQIHGIGRVKAIELSCIAELSKRLWRTKTMRRIDIHDAATIAAYYRQELQLCAQEQVYAMLADEHGSFLRSVRIGTGTVRSLQCSPRDVFRAALLHRAACFFLVHNHPSGNCNPSKEDRRLKDTLKFAGEQMDVPLRDFIILGEGNPGYFSFAEQQLL